MINFKFLAIRLSNLDFHSRDAGGARRSRRLRKPLCRFSAQVARLEDRLLMSKDVVVEMPQAFGSTEKKPIYNTVGHLSDVLFVSNNIVGATPMKEITITNNESHTIYPILYDPNTGKSTTGNYYDPIDMHNQEYRGYIGYTENGHDYLGLQAHHSVTIDVPFVFWDSGRAALATDPYSLLPKDPSTSKASATTNPFFFFYYTLAGDPKTGTGQTSRFVVNAAKSTDGDGIVMYYHCGDPGNNAVDPGADAPDQLIEWTIRDKKFLTAISQNYGKIDKSQLIDLINYDVSYVDHMLLPVAMEATNVPIPNTSKTKDYGWVGADISSAALQAKMLDFTKDNTKGNNENGLGDYFGGLGWPKFYNPNYKPDNEVGIRIPSGASLLLLSPLANRRSSYNNNLWMLSSGGDKPIEYFYGGKLDGQSQGVITDSKAFAILKKGMTVKVSYSTLAPVSVGTIDTLTPASKTVTFTGKVPSNIPTNADVTFTFAEPVSDPYATKITNLWYTWANYYANQSEFKNFQKPIKATVENDTDNGGNDPRILTMTQAEQSALALGMRVTGANIRSLVTILKIGTYNNLPAVYLSQPLVGVTAGQQIQFTFYAPATIPYTNPQNIIPFKFKTQAEQDYAKAFSATVYELLSVFSTATTPSPTGLPGATNIVYNTIGGNVGFLPTATPTNYVNISNDVRDLVKSALRGVPNFITKTTGWYPDPSKSEGGQVYNVYNLDPFAWFVHEKLGFSGYGFSFDDDSADVGANGTSTLSIAIGGLTGIPNKDEWGASAPWGDVKTTATITPTTYMGKTTSLITLTDPAAYYRLKSDDPANAIVGAYVTGNGIVKGTNLLANGPIDTTKGTYSYYLSESATTTTTAIPVIFTAKKPT